MTIANVKPEPTATDIGRGALKEIATTLDAESYPRNGSLESRLGELASAAIEAMDSRYNQELIQALELSARFEALEALRPHWAQGYTSDSVAAQTMSSALGALWQLLGVNNQTDACAAVRALRAYSSASPEAVSGDASPVAPALACPQCGGAIKEYAGDVGRCVNNHVVEPPPAASEILAKGGAVASIEIAAEIALGAHVAPTVDERIERLKVAIEGECDGLAIDDETAKVILLHANTGADPDDIRAGRVVATTIGAPEGERLTPAERAFWDASVDFMNRRVKVEDTLLAVAAGKRGPIEADEAKALAVRLGVPSQPGEPVTLVYTNWRGETAARSIIPRSVWYGSTEWHPEPQWLLQAFDVEKQADRDFALIEFGTGKGA